MSKDGKSAKDRAADAALSVALAQARQRRDEATGEYEGKTEGLSFTKDFNGAVEAIMNDQMATAGQRFLAWLKRYAWGEYSLYAIGEDGLPKFQVDAVRELGLSKSRVSHVVAYYEARGQVRTQDKMLYPVISPELGPRPEKVADSRNFSKFLEDWKVANSSNFQELEVARSTVKRIQKVILSDYKKFRQSATKADLTLLETARCGPDLPPAGSEDVLTPFQESNLRAEAQAQAKTIPDGVGSHSKAQARDFLFAEIARMQKAYKHTQFATPPIDPASEDHQRLVNLILKTLGRHDEEYLVGYIVWMSAKFKGIGSNKVARPPGRPGGPEGLGLLVNWAADYARVAGGHEEANHA